MTRKDITEYLRIFILELSKKETYPPKINSAFDALRIKELLNNPKNTTFKSISDFSGMPYWHEQQVDYVPSNLKNREAYLFYFICNGCEERVKYLYEYNILESPLCRKCCRLGYVRGMRKRKILLANNPLWTNHRSASSFMADESEYEPIRP